MTEYKCKCDQMVEGKDLLQHIREKHPQDYQWWVGRMVEETFNEAAVAEVVG